MSASIIRYRKLVTTDVTSQAVNLSESGTMGHRVQIPISVDDLNTLFVWDRPVGSDRPVGHFNADSPDAPFDTILSNSLSKIYTDIDGITNGLNFSSAILDANNDSRVRKGGDVLANDIVMCYVIYKCYGSSSAATEGIVYNLQDAQDMLSNGALVSAIHTSMANEETLTNNPGVDKGSIDAMFRDLLAADPSRFFDAAGRQIPGLFETVIDTDARGNWCFVENDKIEIAVQMRFASPVTRYAVGEGEDMTQTVVIPAGSIFKIRLQLVATDTPSGVAAKQEVIQANTSAEISRQADATAKAATNAATAQRAAAQAVSTAAAQSAAVQARYQKAVDDNAKQASAVAKAQAALQAAQASLNQAIISGRPDSDIQNQRAAAVAAMALVENLQAIAEVALSDLQNAKLATDAATVTLAATQTAAAAASENLASLNAAAALAAKAKADDSASAAAINKAAADAASDPLTKAISDAESAILDPQTLVNLDAAKNSATIRRISAHEAESLTQAKQILATQKYNIIRYNIDYAISLGKNDSEIQVLRTQLSRALADKTIADLQASSSLSTLTGSYDIESRAIFASIQSKKDAAALSARMYAANINDAMRKLASATTAFTYASTLTADALSSANDAQATLDLRISGGATFNEVQTRRKAVLDANTFLAERKAASDTANAKLIDCQTALNTAQTVKTAADNNVTSVNTESDYIVTLYQSSIAASMSYQAQKVEGASAAQIDLDVTNALIQLNIAKDKSASADSVYGIAKRNFDAALAGGKRLAEITVLQKISQDAQLEKQRSDLILQTSQMNYNKYVPTGQEAAAIILNSAADFQSTQIEQANMNTKAILYNSTLAFYLDASANLMQARISDDIMLKNLNAAITGGMPLAQTTVLRNQKVDTSNTYAKALSYFNAASAAMSTVTIDVTENPNVSTILYSATVLRESENNSAKSSDLMRMSNEVFTEFATVASNVEFTYQNSEALKDILATALANGKSLEEISQIQESLRNNTIQYANYTMKYEQLSAEYDAVSEQMSADQNLISSLANSYNVWNYATVYSRASQNIKDLTTAQISKNTAQSDLASIQAEYDVITELSLTAQRQGQTIAETSNIRSTLNGKGIELANKTVILNNSINSLSTAQDNWNTVKNLLFASDSVSTIIQTQDNTYKTIASTLTANVNSLALSISSAKSNMLTRNLTQTYIDMIHLSTLVIEDNNLYMNANDALNTAIIQGHTLSEIQDLRLKLQEYSAKKVMDYSDLTNKTSAYQSSLQIASQSQDAKGILDVVAQMQTIVLEGGKSNELLRNLIDTKNVAYNLSIEDTAVQSELLLAQSALQVSNANGEVLSDSYDNILSIGYKAAIIRQKLIAANTAVTFAQINVDMNPNVQAIYDINTNIYKIQNDHAAANILTDQYFAAKQFEATVSNDLKLVKNAFEIATSLFDNAISSGSDITAIQNARNNLNVAGTQLMEATTACTYAKAALETALSNSNSSQIAVALITTASVNDANVVAGATVTTAQYKLNLIKDSLANAIIVSDAASLQAQAATTTLDLATSNGKTSQEIEVLRGNALEASNNAAISLETMRKLMNDVLEQQALVDKYTSIYTETQADVLQNNRINYLLFNGFVYQASVNKYVLKKDMVPGTIAEGVNIALYSLTITPINSGVYSATDSYKIGDLVYYPTDSSAQYMCLVATDSTNSSITNKNPIDNSICWILTQDAQFRYNSTVDLMIENPVANTLYSTIVPLIGELSGLQTLFLNSDNSGNNLLMNQLIVFGDLVESSNPTNPATIISTTYINGRNSLQINISQRIINNSVLYIKNAKTILNAAVLDYNIYMTNLIADGFTPVTTIGSLTKSFMNTTLLPTTITAGTTFSLGSSSITPTLRGVYSSTTSYTTGDLVTNSNETIFMCLVGRDSRGASYEITIGNAPVARPAISSYWYIVENHEWDSFTYNSTTDLPLTLTGFGSILWTSTAYPPNINIQILNPAFISGYTIFGTGVTEETFITGFDHVYSSDGVYSYRFTLSAPTSTNINDTFYVKNANVVFESGVVSAICNNLSAYIISAMSYAKSIVTMTTASAASTAITDIATIKTSVNNLKTVYLTNTTVSAYMNTSISTIDACMAVADVQSSLLNLYLKYVSRNDTSAVNSLATVRTNSLTNITTIETNVTSIKANILLQNNVSIVSNLNTINTQNALIRSSYEVYDVFTVPTNIAYTSLRAAAGGGGYIMVNPTNLSTLSIGTGDYTLEFITIANQSNDFVMNPIGDGPGFFGMKKTAAFPFAMDSYKGPYWPLTPSTGNIGNIVSSNDLMNAGYRTGTGNSNTQNHFAMVRHNSVSRMYMNGNLVKTLSNDVYNIVGSNMYIFGGHNAYVTYTGGMRNFRFDASAVYTSSFNTTNIIMGTSNSVFNSNLQALSTTKIFLPLNNGAKILDYSPYNHPISKHGFTYLSTVTL